MDATGRVHGQSWGRYVAVDSESVGDGGSFSG
jgi:hypothetical protein